MTILFAGGELEAFTVSGSGVAESAVAGYYDTTYARTAIRCGQNDSAAYIESPVFATQTDIWVHWERFMQGTSSNFSEHLVLFNSSGVPVFRLNSPSNRFVQFQYWNGSTWINTGSSYEFANGSGTAAARQIWDVRLICGASGSFEAYIDGVLTLSGSVPDADVNNVQKVRWYSGASSNTPTNNQHVSQCIVADLTTLDHKLYLKPPTSDGAVNTWSGSYADIDETPLSDSDMTSGSANGDIDTYKGAAFPSLPTDFEVKAIITSSRIRRGASGVANAKHVLRIGGVNYESAALGAFGTSFVPRDVIWHDDPSTGSPWGETNAIAATTEFGAVANT